MDNENVDIKLCAHRYAQYRIIGKPNNLKVFRDRPFNLKGGGGGGVWFFVSFRKKLSDNTRVRIFILFVAQSANLFSRI